MVSPAAWAWAAPWFGRIGTVANPATSAAQAAPIMNLREPTDFLMDFSPAPGGQGPSSSCREGYTGLPPPPTSQAARAEWFLRVKPFLTLVQHGLGALIQKTKPKGHRNTR